MELIDDGGIDRISDLVGRLSERLEARQGGYSIMLTLKSEEAQGIFALYLKDNSEATQEELMEAATER